MNLSQANGSCPSREKMYDCKNVFIESVSLRYPAGDSFKGLFVAAAVLNLAACPLTIFLNALVMFAVKTKRRLQTHLNVLLACLALTDLMVGLVVQPLHITNTIFLLQGKHFHEFCDIDFAFTLSFVISCWASVSHLVLISGERYLAIKHTFTHASVVTKAPVVFCSALAWFAVALFPLILSYSAVVAFSLQATNISLITLFQVVVYKKARCHEKQILAQHVSVKIRAKFKREKKALKLTTIILVTIFMCFFFPLVSVFVTWQVFRETFSPEVKTVIRHLVYVPMIINSVVNPVIYTVKKRQFRVAFIELVLRKSLREAEEFHRRMFGSWNNAVRPQTGQEGEKQGQNAENENASNPDDIHEDSPKV